jgi:hypothetical protein
VNAADPRQSDDLEHELGRLLRRGHRPASQLIAALRVSQPTLSRTIRALSGTVTTFRETGIRTPQYGLLRDLPIGLSARQRIYRCLSTGNIEPFADLEFLAGGYTVERIGNATRLYTGLPPYIHFAAPSGFLGRQVAHVAATEHPFPGNLKDWNDDHRVAYLFTQGLNLPGNLIFGPAPLQRELDLMAARPTRAEEKVARYVEMATALKGAIYGSSAGGEQPKFLWLTEDTGHVIVKFAKLGSRMATLLPLEHLALRSLAEVGVPASSTQLLAGADYVFLEVKRFDRIGLTGRVGMLSAGSIDDESFGKRDSWSQFAARCKQARYLATEDVRNIDVMAAFSELIGNNDRHFENISLLIGDDGKYQGVAPAYDILPMRYASLGGGVDPDLTPIEPKVGTIGAQPEVWACAAEAAERFWLAAMTENLPVPVPYEMRQLARENMQVAKAFVAPLLPR